METIAHFLTTPALHKAGTIAFLAVLGLTMGSCWLAFFAEFKGRTGARADYPVLSHKITGSALIWVVLLSLWGGATIFLPRLPEITNPGPLRLIALGFAGSLILYLLYHFTTPLFKVKFLHAPLALVGAGAALLAAAYWYLPHTCADWFKMANSQSGPPALFSWLLDREEIARFIFFTLNGVILAALVFLLANAREKENRRKHPREYYFKAASFIKSWLIGIVTLQLIPVAWLYYRHTLEIGSGLWPRPEIYWLAASLLFFLLGWLLLLKIVIDGLVNHRATLIIAIMFFISLGIFSFSPINVPGPQTGLDQPKPTPAKAVAPTPEPPAPTQPEPKQPTTTK